MQSVNCILIPNPQIIPFFPFFWGGGDGQICSEGSLTSKISLKAEILILNFYKSDKISLWITSLYQKVKNVFWVNSVNWSRTHRILLIIFLSTTLWQSTLNYGSHFEHIYMYVYEITIITLLTISVSKKNYITLVTLWHVLTKTFIVRHKWAHVYTISTLVVRKTSFYPSSTIIPLLFNLSNRINLSIYQSISL